MKKTNLTILAFFILEILVSGAAFAQTSASSVSRALKKFEGTYELVDQKLSKNPRSEESAVCYQQIQIQRPTGPNCRGCKIDLEVLGLPSGQGLIVVQMSEINQGRKIEPIENPMFPGIMGTQESKSEVHGNELSHMMISRTLSGKVNFSVEFEAALAGDVLDLTVHNTNSISGFVDHTASCRYQRQ